MYLPSQNPYENDSVDVDVELNGRFYKTKLLLSAYMNFFIADSKRRLYLALFNVEDGTMDNYIIYLLHHNHWLHTSYEVKIYDEVLEKVKAEVKRTDDGKILPVTTDCFLTTFETVIAGRSFADGDYNKYFDIKMNFTELPSIQSGSEVSVVPTRFFSEFFDQKLFTDFIIKCSDGVEVPVHRLMLSKVSPYFMKLCTVEMQEKDENLVEFSDIDSSTMNEMLNFIFKSEFAVESATQAMDLIYAADKFQINDLKSECSMKCVKLIKMSNVLKVFFFAELYKIEVISMISVNMIIENFEELEKTQEWKDLTNEQITKVTKAIIKFNAKYPPKIHVFSKY